MDPTHPVLGQDATGSVPSSEHWAPVCSQTHGKYYASASAGIIMTFHSESLTWRTLVFQSPTASFPFGVKTGFVRPAEEDFPKGKVKREEIKERFTFFKS